MWFGQKAAVTWNSGDYVFSVSEIFICIFQVLHEPYSDELARVCQPFIRTSYKLLRPVALNLGRLHTRITWAAFKNPCAKMHPRIIHSESLGMRHSIRIFQAPWMIPMWPQDWEILHRALASLSINGRLHTGFQFVLGFNSISLWVADKIAWLFFIKLFWGSI